mgnify:CR=1 FL=1
MHRFKEIDMLKGLGIVFMIMGHQYYGEYFDKWIHAFHMPMFFLISGFLYHRPNILKKSIYNKVKSLLIPYVFFAFIHLTIMYIKNLLFGGTVKNLHLYIYHILIINTEGLPICGAIWFLTALFFATIMFIVIDTYIPKTVIKVICVLISVYMGLIIPNKGIRLPLALDVSLVGVGLLFIGKTLRSIYEKIRIQKNCLLAVFGILGMVFGSIIINFNSIVNMRLGVYGIVVFFFINAVIMTISLYLLCFMMSSKKNFIINELSFIGQYSVVYLGFNQLILILLKKINVTDLYLNFCIKIISLILCLAILHIVAILITNSKVKGLIGK